MYITFHYRMYQDLLLGSFFSFVIYSMLVAEKYSCKQKWKLRNVVRLFLLKFKTVDIRSKKKTATPNDQIHRAKIVPGHSAYSQDQYNYDKDKFPLSPKAPLNRIYFWVCCVVL